MYKKILTLSMAACVFFALTGCNKKANLDQNFDEVTTETTTQQTTQGTSEETTAQTTAAPGGSVTFENVPTDKNNPIDKALESKFDEADSTQKINKVSEDYYTAWKTELEEIATACRENGIDGFNQAEYDRILTSAQAAYDEGMKMGGSEASGNALFSAGTIYKQGTYYFATLYKAHMGKEYTYLYK